MELRHFKSLNKVSETEDYVSALEAFDSIPQLQELKAVARKKSGISQGDKVLDVGCGFGLETTRLAKLVQPNGAISGLDLSSAFIDEARKRAALSDLGIDYATGAAQDLPYADNRFDHVRAERILIYLRDYQLALSEMKRVLRPGGRLSLIEPDFSTNTINLPNRDLVRRVIDHEVSQAVEQGWLPGPLLSSLNDLGFEDIEVSTRVLIFPQDLAAGYFNNVGDHAKEAHVISDDELTEWQNGIDSLQREGQIFATISYFLFSAICPDH
ncbi:Demethylmenaquinone methyltransferase [Roseibium album]|nr:Demethylmenaquinone methyltransferase [Roseibium album]